MVLNNVTKFHTISIKTTGLTDWTPSKMVKFHEQRAITPEGMIIELVEEIMVLINGLKFFKIPIKTI